MLKRRVLDDVKYVPRFDAAIDDGSDYSAYEKTWDLSKLVCKPGEQFTVFTLRQLSDRQRAACYREADTLDRCALALRYGLTGVDNYTIVSPTGEQTILEQPKRINAAAGSMISDEWMDKARFLVEEQLAIGATILAITEARPPL